MEEQKKDEQLNNPLMDSAGSPQASSGQDKPAEVSELDKIKQERDEYLNGWKRAKADLINYQKDEGKRFQEMARYGVEMVLADMITILDSFAALEKSFQGAAESEPRQGREPRSIEVERDLIGVLVVKNQLENVLKKRGLERMKINIGDAFNPNYHESIGEAGPPADGSASGTIIEVAVAGYTMDGKVVRPAKVKIAK